MRLEGRVAVVTGGARGIGCGIARCLAREGARVAVSDLDASAAEKTAAELGPDHLGIGCDASDEDASARSIARVV